MTTSAYATELHVYLDTFENEVAEAQYSSSSVSDADSGYVISVSGYSGTAGDSFKRHNGMILSTHDKDQDNSTGNCSAIFKGAWWYNDCHHSNLNGQYFGGLHTTYADGVNWYRFKDSLYSLRTVIMKLKRLL